MTYIVRWQGFFENNSMAFDTREAAKAYADSLVMLKHVRDVKIEEVK